VTDWLPASVVDQEHIGWWVRTEPMSAPARLLAVEHGGPFPVPPELVEAGMLPPSLAHIADAPYLPPDFTTQLHVQPLQAGIPTEDGAPPFYVWLVPHARVHLIRPAAEEQAP
jgi:hypothetical protein